MNPTVNPSEFVPREPWPAEGPSRAPYWTFVDPATYEREQQRIFRGSAWHFLGLEAEVPEPGSFKTNRVGDTPVVLTRDAAPDQPAVSTPDEASIVISDLPAELELRLDVPSSGAPPTATLSTAHSPWRC